MAGTFSYQFGANPAIDWPRLMISDTVQFASDGVTPIYVFADQEIAAITLIVQAQFQSAQFYSPPSGQNLPTQPVPWLRVAAALLDCIAANKAKLASITRILDVSLDPSKAAKLLMDQAKAYRDADDNSGAFFVIEQVSNEWALYDRYWKQVQRQQGVPF